MLYIVPGFLTALLPSWQTPADKPLTLQSSAALALQFSAFRGLETTERNNACKTPSTAFRPCYGQVLITASIPESL